MKKYHFSLFIFRRDLRLEDNTGLIDALRNSEQVMPCIIFEPKFFKKSSQKFCKSRQQFFYECIVDLSDDLKNKNSKLFYFWGKPEKIIQKLNNHLNLKAVFTNRDYTQASKKRDLAIKKFCKNKNIDFISADDLLLHDVDQIMTKQKTPYKVFSQFFNSAKNYSVKNSQKNNFSNYFNGTLDFDLDFPRVKELFGINKSKKPIGGRKACKNLLENLKSIKNYENDRNFPGKNQTTKLSAHNRFGTFSIREVYHRIANNLGNSHTLLTELHWRDFFTYVMYHYPHSFSKNFHSKYDKLSWSRNKKNFKRWCDGKTGFPIVDAGMRELNHTGFMHNRVRMIVASFLTKDLHIDWKWGERYFASKLLDYDPSVNVGNWQWAASTGCDSQPWFRIFNPWLQQKKFDPECVYIKKWIPELENYTTKEIHNWEKQESEKYPCPMVDHTEESNITKEIFSKISRS